MLLKLALTVSLILAPAIVWAKPPVLPLVPPGTPGIPVACSGPAALHNPFCTGGAGGAGGTSGGNGGTASGSAGGSSHVLRSVLTGFAVAYPFLVLFYYDVKCGNFDGPDHEIFWENSDTSYYGLPHCKNEKAKTWLW